MPTQTEPPIEATAGGTPQRFHGRFRRGCELIALIYLLVVPLVFMVRRPFACDLGQYYMGGLVALEGEWEALYPTPHPNATLNAGFGDGAIEHPRYRELARAAGVPKGSRFISPPPMALVLAPLAALPFYWARLCWTVFMALLCFLAARESAKLLERLHGRATPWSGVFLLLACVSPVVWRTLRLGQLTPVGAWFVAITFTGVVAGRSGRTAVGVVGSSLSKQIGAVHLPLLAVLGRWGALLRMAVLSAAVILTSLAVMGAGPFEAWFSRVAPSMRHSSPWAGNQSLSGFLLRVLDAEALSAGAQRAVSIAGLAVLAGLTVLVWVRRSLLRLEPRRAVAALAAYTLWAMIFSPISWEHYHLYLFPVWAWLIAECLRRPRLLLVAVPALAASWAPFCVFDSGELVTSEPFVSHMLWASLVFFGLAVFRLVRARQRPA